MAGVVGYENEVVVNSDGRDDNVAEVESRTLAGVVALQLSRESRRIGGDGNVLEAGEERLGGGFFLWPDTGVDFRNVDGTTREQITGFHEIQQERGPVAFVVE